MRSLTPAVLLASFSAIAQTWTQLPDFPGIERDDATAFAIGTYVYVGTGMDAGFQLTSDWYRFNTVSNEWSAVASLPASARQYCASFSIDGLGYVFGGTNGTALNELWAYDPQQDQWSARAPLPSAGLSGSVAFVLNGKGFIATGKRAPDFTPTSELWMYDPANDQWSVRSPLPGDPRALASVFTAGDSAYLCTGQDVQGNAMADGVWGYVPLTDAWSWVSPFFGAGPMFGADAFGLTDKGAIVCGAFTAPPYEPATDVFLPATSEWVWAPPQFPGPGRKGGSGAVVGNSIFYGTGTTGLARLKDWYKLEWPVVIQESAVNEEPRILGSATEENLNLFIPPNWTNAHADIIDLAGRVHRSTLCQAGSNMIGISGSARGTYILRITNERAIRNIRFIITH